MKGNPLLTNIACIGAGALLASCLDIFSSRSILRPALAGISAGEWLQATSAIIGVFLTIQGTLWLEERKRTEERREEERLIREAMLMLKGVLSIVLRPLDNALPLKERIATTAAHFELVRINLESLSYARQSYRVRSIALWHPLSALDNVRAIWSAEIAKEENLVRGQHVTEQVHAICRKQLDAYAKDLLPTVTSAIDALKFEQI